MEKRLWFRRKTYGWGWTPATSEGWFVVLLYVLILISIFRVVDLGSHSGSDTLINFAPRFLLVTLGFYIVCTLTGEKPKWQWGTKHPDTHNDER